jgi:hypothetical protein
VLVLDAAPVLFKDQLLNTSSQGGSEALDELSNTRNGNLAETVGHSAMISVMERIAELTHEHHLLSIVRCSRVQLLISREFTYNYSKNG